MARWSWMRNFVSDLTARWSFCGLTNKLRKNQPALGSLLLLVNTSHWNWDTARHCGLFKAAMHCEGEREGGGCLMHGPIEI